MEKPPMAQDDIDAMFSAARAQVKQKPVAVAGPRVLPYVFSRGGQINNDQMRAISLLNDMFARNLTHNLGAFLRSRLGVNLVSAEQMPFAEFLDRIPDVAYVCSVRLEPLGAVCLMQLDLSLASPMIDLLLGGEGRPGVVRELTDIEEAILSSVVGLICREMSSAWQQVGLSFEFEKRQMNTQVSRLMPLTEKTLCVSFEIRMPESQGMLNLAFPAVVSNTILRRLVRDWGRQSRRRSGELRRQMEMRLAGVNVGVSLHLPEGRIPAQELKNLEVGQTVRLRLPIDSPAEFRAGGVLLFHAAPVRHGEHRGAHLTDRLPPPVEEMKE